jgi:hypothetical protein
MMSSDRCVDELGVCLDPVDQRIADIHKIVEFLRADQIEFFCGDLVIKMNQAVPVPRKNPQLSS